MAPCWQCAWQQLYQAHAHALAGPVAARPSKRVTCTPRDHQAFRSEGTRREQLSSTWDSSVCRPEPSSVRQLSSKRVPSGHLPHPSATATALAGSALLLPQAAAASEPAPGLQLAAQAADQVLHSHSCSLDCWAALLPGLSELQARVPEARLLLLPAPGLLADSSATPARQLAAWLAASECWHVPLAALGGSLSQGLFGLGQQADALVQQELAGVTPATYAVVLGAGLLTSLSPCTLSVLPLTIGYIGGYGSAKAGEAGAGSGLVGRSVAFAGGLATTLAVLGVLSSLAGKAYGQIGSGLPIAVAVVAILMGLNLLEVLPLRLPSLDLDVRSARTPPLAQAYLAGLTFALAASPCSTPVLATLLAYTSSTRDPVVGGSLLLAYTSGYCAPLLAAAAGTGALARVLALRRWSGWLTPASGVLLLAGGTYALLSRLLPA